MTKTNGPATGQSATLTFTVSDNDTAIAVGSGDVAVLGTPRLLAWCEGATIAAVAPHVGPGTTTVGFKIEIDHLAPTPVGASVRATATVEEVDGRRIRFSVQAHDPAGAIASGTVTRIMVDRDGFSRRAADRC